MTLIHETLYTIQKPSQSHNSVVVRASARSTIIQALTARLIRVHAVGALVGTIISHAVVRAVEAEASNARVSLDTSSLLKAGGEIV